MKKANNKKQLLGGSPFLLSWLFILVLLLFYALTRLMLWIVSYSLFPWEGFGPFLQIVFGGCRFDLSALLMVNLPFLFFFNLPFPIRDKRWYRVLTALLFAIANFLALAANLADSVYYRFTLKRMTGDFFNYLKAGGNDLINLLPQYLKDFWYLPATLVLCMAVLLILFFKSKPKAYSGKGSMAVFKDLFFFLVVMGFSVIGIRGGFQLKPIHLITAGQYANPAHVPLVINTPFSMIKTWNHKEIKEVHYFHDQDELMSVFNPFRKASENPWQPLNIVIIILESFSAEYSAYLNPELEKDQYRGYMPFLDSIMDKSLTFRGYANGKRSIEAIPAILSSMPSWMNNDFATSSYAGNQMTSLANALTKEAYHTAFYHGGNNGTMNFDAFAKMAGFEQYHGRDEYNNDEDYDGKWGIFDEPFFQYCARDMNKTKPPFLGVIFSLSSHHPYTIPARHQGRFPMGPQAIHQSVAYTDYALKRFFQTAAAMPWFKNTLFVITADHTSEAHLPLYKTRLGNYLIPIVFYRADTVLQADNARVVQQIDIMPSVLDYIGYRDTYISFGNSVFDRARYNYALSYLNDSYLMVKEQHVLLFSTNEATAIYDLKKDPMQKINLLNKREPTELQMIRFLKAVIQQYNFRVIHNQLST